jgi:hypothetical protein
MSTPEHRRIRGNEARQLLDNQLLKEAFTAVGQYVDDQALACPPDDATRAQRIVISKQLLAAIKRELVRVVEDGDVAEVQIDMLEKQRGLMNRFRR